MGHCDLPRRSADEPGAIRPNYLRIRIPEQYVPTRVRIGFVRSSNYRVGASLRFVQATRTRDATVRCCAILPRELRQSAAELRRAEASVGYEFNAASHTAAGAANHRQRYARDTQKSVRIPPVSFSREASLSAHVSHWYRTHRIRPTDDRAERYA